MKRAAFAVTIIFTVLSFLTIPAIAADKVTDYTIYYDDGSYAVVTLSNSLTRVKVNETKSYTYYNPLGQRCFAYTLFASFTYNGTTSWADSCDFGVAIYRQSWDINAHSEYVSGNSAYGNATFTSPDGQVRTASLTLTCDKNGNVT